MAKQEEDLAKRIADALVKAKLGASQVAVAKEIRFKTGTYTVTFDHHESKLYEAKTGSIGFKVVLTVVAGPCNIGSTLYQNLWLKLAMATEENQRKVWEIANLWQQKLGLTMDQFSVVPELLNEDGTPRQFEVLVECDKGGDYSITRIDRI
jgi:hypothetical protein